MELIIGLLVIGVVGYFVFFHRKDEATVSSAPYKVETPMPAPQPVPDVQTVNEVLPVAIADVPVTVEVTEPVVEKKTRKPRAPKAEKAAVKKAAPKKVAAKKTAKSKKA
jgi:BRCT domain type II-containing protein